MLLYARAGRSLWVGSALSHGAFPLDCDNRSLTRAGGCGVSGRNLAEVNGIALSLLGKKEVVMLQNRAVEAPWRSSLAQSNKRSATYPCTDMTLRQNGA